MESSMVLASEAAIQALAREMIERHGAEAALRATERLNDRIDNADWNGRDLWAAVVHAIHDLQRAVSLVSLQRGDNPRN
jgi:hypothetical protein